MRQLVPAPPTTKLRATTTPLEVDAKDFGSFSDNRLYQLIREQHNVLSRPTSSLFSRVRVVSDASFRRMTRWSLSAALSVTAVVRRERGTEVTDPTVIGIRSKFPVLYN